MRQVYNPEATNAVEVLRCDSNRIPFLIEWYIGDIINFNDCTILLVDINQVLLESRNAVHPHDIAKSKIIPTPIEVPAVKEC